MPELLRMLPEPETNPRLEKDCDAFPREGN